MSITRIVVAAAVLVFTPIVTSAHSTLDVQLEKQREALQNGDPDASLVEVMILSEKIQLRDFFVESGFSEQEALFLAEKRRAIYEKCLPAFEEAEGSAIDSLVKIILASNYCESLANSAVGFRKEVQQEIDVS